MPSLRPVYRMTGNSGCEDRELARELHAGHAGHLVVGDHEVARPGVVRYSRPALRPAFCRLHDVQAPALEQIAHERRRPRARRPPPARARSGGAAARAARPALAPASMCSRIKRGKQHAEARAFARRGIHDDVPAQLVHDAVHAREPHAAAFADFLRGEERLEYAIDDVRRDAGPVVLDATARRSRRSTRWRQAVHTCLGRRRGATPTRMVPAPAMASRALRHRLSSIWSSCTGSSITARHFATRA